MHPRAGALLLCALLLAAAAAAQGTRVLEVVVRDEAGAPVPGAALFLHRQGTGSVTGADGRALLRPEAPDVLVAAAHGRALGLRHLGAALPDELEVRLGPADRTPVRQELTEARRSLEPGLPLGPLGTTGPPSAVVAFDMEPGARGGIVEVTYLKQEADLRVDLVHRGTAQRYGYLTGSGGSGNISFAIPATLARGLPGGYDLELRPRDGAILDGTVDVRATVDYGPLAWKVVEGRPPEVQAPDGTTGRLLNPTMDIVGVRFLNETPSDFEVQLLLDAFTGPDAGSAARGVWAVQWAFENRTYMVSYVHERQPSPGVPERFLAGPCVDGVCVRERLIPGGIVPGDPGAIVFHVPKEGVGAPPDGAELTAPRGITFLSYGRPNTFSEADMLAFEVDRTPGGAPYRLGVHEFAVPAATFEALRRGPVLSGGAGAAVEGVGLWGPVALGLALAAGAGAVLVLRRRAAAPTSPPTKYEVLRPLGEGASGRTFLARHRELGKLVALKVLASGGQGDTQGRARALREARIAGALRHPNVVEVYDVEEGPQGTRIVMEYVDGGSLQERLGRGPVAPEEALRLWADVARGLAAIHAAEVVHRDVKPSNVLLTSEGRAKLADFGVAHASLEGTLGGERGSPVGTPLYMAPEQLRGEPASAASDVYAATAVAYAMLAGRPHLEVQASNAWDALLAVRGASPALPVPGLPRWVNALLAAGLAADPARRPAAGAMLEALERRRGAAR